MERLADYRAQHSPFVDAYAVFSVGLLESHLGLGPLHPRSVLATYALTEPTLRLEIDGSPVPRTALSCLPHGFTETAETSGLTITAQGAFVHGRLALYEVTLHNPGAEPWTGNARLVGAGQGEHPNYMLPFFPGAKLGGRALVVRADSGVEVALDADPESCDLPGVALRIEVEEEAAKPFANGAGFGFQLGTEPLPPGASRTVRFRLEVRVGAVGFAPPEAIPPTDEVWAARQTALAGVFDGLPSGADGRLAARARLALMRCGLADATGEFGPSVASLCTADRSDFSCSFFWDSLFSAVAIADFEPEYAKGAIRTAFTRHLERDGSTPERKWSHGVPQRMLQQAPQSPVAAWAVEEFLRRHDDPEFLAQVYPFLARNHRFWEVHSDTDRDGLSEYRWTGQVSDNSPLWDAYLNVGATAVGCGWVPPVASVALNCFLFKDAGHLARLARRLGREDEARAYEARREARQRAIDAHLYLPDERRYWDFNHHTLRHERVRTFWMFWPLYAELEVPTETARDLIENVLLDPRQFFGPIPFPSVAYDEPTYDPGGYWRGRTWPHISFWLLETLWKQGFHTEADTAADRLLEAWSAYDGFPENISSQPESGAKPGCLDYNWGCAAYLLTLGRAYRRPIVGNA